MATGSDGDLILLERRALTRGEVGILTFNRPDQRNPLDHSTVVALDRQLDGLIADEVVRAVIVTGAPPAFSAGGDLRGYLDLYQDGDGFRAFLETIRTAYDKLEQSRLLSIAAVNGVCVAGGFELVLACDLVLMARTARMGDGHLKFWQLPGGGGSQRLPRAVGFPVAKRLFYTYELLGAEECVRLGLALAAYDEAELLDRALELADRVTQVPQDTVTTLKGLLQVAAEEPLGPGLDREIDELVRYTAGTESAAYQGLLQFMER
jgi:enoyl-CoA hydratase